MRPPSNFLNVRSSIGPSPLDSLALARQFSLESQSRAIDACEDIDELRRIAKSLLTAWHMQSDLTRRYGAQALGIPVSS